MHSWQHLAKDLITAELLNTTKKETPLELTRGISLQQAEFSILTINYLVQVL